MERMWGFVRWQAFLWRYREELHTAVMEGDSTARELVDAKATEWGLTPFRVADNGVRPRRRDSLRRRVDRPAPVGTFALAVAGLAALAATCGASASSRGAASSAIAFWRACGTSCGDIYTVEPGGVAQRITIRRQAIDPAWAPDRASLVFASDRRHLGRYALHRLRLSDRAETQLTRPRGASDTAPTIRGDGVIAFVRTWAAGGRSALLVVEGGRTRVLARGRGLSDPAWSPDGRRIAYTAIRGGIPHVVLLVVASGRSRPLTAAGGSQPAWAPDGRRLAYVDERDPGLVVHDLASGRARRVVARIDARSPDFSPDGRRIVFSAEVSRRRAGTALFVVGAAGGRPRQLTEPPVLAHDVGADW